MSSDTSIQLIAFDLDDTLTASKSPMDPRMARLLISLLDVADVCVISGGSFHQFESRLLSFLGGVADGSLAHLHLMPTYGSRYYRWHDAQWRELYAEDLSYEDRRRIIATLTKGAKELGYWEEVRWGERIEDRGSLVTFSALGQEAPQEAKKAWDPTNEKKQRLCAYVARCLPDLEVRVNGFTSVDVTLKGVDKAYGMRKIMHYLSLNPRQIIFVGDRLYEGGNDYPVKATGIRCLAVSSWTDTAKFIENYIAGRG